MKPFYTKWHNVDKVNLSGEEIVALIEGFKLYRWNSIGIGAALGIRAAFRGLAELDVKRNEREITEACVRSGYCFAQAIEYICAAPHLRGKLKFELSNDFSSTRVILKTKDRQVKIKLREVSFADESEVFNADDSLLFESVT